jgi:limonene-1,2-epoxide hydrolase
MTAIDLVLDFGRAWERCDVDAILSMMTPDAEYDNVPLPKIKGQAAIRTFITPNLQAAKRIEWEFLNVAVDASGCKVMTERVDRFVFDEGLVAVPLMGIFEVEDGRIARWRDYADLGSFARAMATIGRSSSVTRSV